MSRPRARYFIHDRASGVAAELADFNTVRGGDRFMIVDRVTGKCVDEAMSMYEARQALRAVQEPMPTEPVTGQWVVTADRDGRRHYVRADGHVIDGHGYGRMRWTVLYPDGNYGMTDSLAEAKAWADA